MNKINSSIFAFSLTVSVGMLATSPAISGVPTPDGVTPANEMVCDDLKADGTTKGLYGLCVAYCEATDSPEDLTSPEKLAALPTKSKRILDNYNRKRGDADPQMPCATYHEESSCPAWTPEQLAMVGTHAWYDIRYDDHEEIGSGYYTMYDAEATTSYPYYWAYNQVQVSAGTTYTAAYYDVAYVVSGATGYESRSVQNVLSDITQAQYEACKKDIEDHVM